MKYFKIVIIFILFSFIACLQNEENNIELEQKVFNDIFSELLNRTVQDFRKLPNPPPPPKNNSDEEIKKMKQTFKDMEIDHQKYIDTTQFSPLTIYVNDSTYRMNESSFKELSMNQKNKFYKNSQNTSQKSFQINLKNIPIDSTQYVLKFKSTMNKTFQELKIEDNSIIKHKRKHVGSIGFSRIQFNEYLTEGVFMSTFYCGKLCGCHFTVFIKKLNNKWIITDIDNNGCA